MPRYQLQVPELYPYPDAPRIILLETALSELAQACWMSFLFALRAPSETIRLQRAYRNDDISAFCRQKEKAMIGGTRESGWHIPSR